MALPSLNTFGPNTQIQSAHVNENFTNLRDSLEVSPVTADSDAAVITFDMGDTNKHTVTLGGNRTLAVSDDYSGQTFLVTLVQDGTGSRTVTWWSNISWVGGSAPTLTTTADKADTFGFLVVSSGNYYGFIVGQNI